MSCSRHHCLQQDNDSKNTVHERQCNNMFLNFFFLIKTDFNVAECKILICAAALNSSKQKGP